MNGPLRGLVAAVAWMAACALVFAPGLGREARALVGANEAVPATDVPGEFEVAGDPLAPAVFTSHGYPTTSLLTGAGRGGLFAPIVGPDGSATARRTLTDVLVDLEGDNPTLTGGVAIPEVALAAYKGAEARAAELFPGCYVPWQVLAGIGKVESGHGTYAGADASIDEDGTVAKPILGPRLIGGEGISEILDTDGGRMDGDREYDRAVGPMQFIPTSWAAYGQDANGDNVRDPNNFHDASLAAAAHLCGTAPGDYRTDTSALAQAIYGYNQSTLYVSTVLSWINTYRGIEGPGDSGVPSLSPLTPAPEYTPPPYTPPEPRNTPDTDPSPPQVADAGGDSTPSYQGPPAPTPSTNDAQPEPTATPTPSATPTSTPTPTPGAEVCATDTAAPTPGAEPSATTSPEPTPTTTPSTDATAGPTASPEPCDPSTTPTADPSASPSPTPTPTDARPTPEPSPSPGEAPAPEETATATPAPEDDSTSEPEEEGPADDPTVEPTTPAATEEAPTPEPTPTPTPEPTAEPELWSAPATRFAVDGSDDGHADGLQVTAVTQWLEELIAAVNQGSTADTRSLLTGLDDTSGVAAAFIADVDAAGPVAADLVTLRYEGPEEPVDLSVTVWRIHPDGRVDDEAEPWLSAEFVADGDAARLERLEVR